jgi:hypothetical protein
MLPAATNTQGTVNTGMIAAGRLLQPQGADVKGRMRGLSGGATINVYCVSVAANGTKY